MSLTQKFFIDQITIEANGFILLRTSNIIFDGTNEIAKSYSRQTLVPAQDLTNQPNNIVEISKIVWTPEVISAYQESLIPVITTTGA